jgi:hypothetical protein
MRRIAVIYPRDRNVIYKTVPDKDISRAAGPALEMHNVIRYANGHSGSYGLFTNSAGTPLEAEYFCLDGKLCHGPTVLYAFDGLGQTVDIVPRAHPQPMWLGSHEAAWAALYDGVAVKPAWWEC